MRQKSRVVVLCLLAALAGTSLASASGFGLFQHGGRATGQAGAFTARASDPSALTYNPAAIAKLNGVQLEAGLDFNNPTDDYKSASGSFDSSHIIQFPPAVYLTWKQKGGPFALGIGIDSPFYYRLEWFPRLFPGRFLARETQVWIYEVHPVLAYDLGDGWSVGGGLRYGFGTLERNSNGLATFQGFPAPGDPVTPPVTVEVQRNAGAHVDGLGWDASVHYAAPSWGWGAVYRSSEKLKGDGDVKYQPLDVPTGVNGLDSALRTVFTEGRNHQSFELPQELRGGIWYAPYPELRIELDAGYQDWASFGPTNTTYSPNPLRPGTTTETIPRDWKSTTSLRLGVEGNLTDNFLLFGGVALEPSPLRGETVIPDFIRGDATVYALGFSIEIPRISLDAAYSYHVMDDVGVSNQELLNPGRSGSYRSRDQVWSASVRWRWF
jgi:long-chain fatty acid transport protein